MPRALSPDGRRRGTRETRKRVGSRPLRCRFWGGRAGHVHLVPSPRVDSFACGAQRPRRSDEENVVIDAAATVRPFPTFLAYSTRPSCTIRSISGAVAYWEGKGERGPQDPREWPGRPGEGLLRACRWPS